MAFLVSQDIFYKGSVTIPEFLWKRDMRNPHCDVEYVDGQVDVKSRLYVGGRNVRNEKQNGSRDGYN